MASKSAKRIRLRLGPGLARWVPKKFLRNEDGVYAIEFAMVALPFLALLFLILETAFVIYAEQILDNAMNDAARLIRTGEAHKQGFSEAEFRKQVCDGLVLNFDCEASLHIDVRSYQTFSAVSSSGGLDDPLDPKTKELTLSGSTYDHGTAEEVVVVRVFYEWPVLNPMSKFSLGDMANGKRLLSAVTAFRNEPFPW